MEPFPYRRIVIIGTTGSGKTALAELLADSLGAPHIELDRLDRPGHAAQTDSVEAFRQSLDRLTLGERWAVDGGHKLAQEVVWPRADLIIWLDYSLATVLLRLLRRRWGRSRPTQGNSPGMAATSSRPRSGLSRRTTNLFRSLYHATRKHYKNKREIPQALLGLGIEPSKVMRLSTPDQTRHFLQAPNSGRA